MRLLVLDDRLVARANYSSLRKSHSSSRVVLGQFLSEENS
jgi:hypothetical protein